MQIRQWLILLIFCVVLWVRGVLPFEHYLHEYGRHQLPRHEEFYRYPTQPNGMPIVYDGAHSKSGTSIDEEDDEDDNGSGKSSDVSIIEEVGHCPPESFEHYFIKGGNEGKVLYTNSWKIARANERVGLQKLCLQPNGMPVTRRCMFSPQSRQPQWENISGWPKIECIGESRQGIISVELNDLHNQLNKGSRVQNATDITFRMNEILQRPERRLLPADIQLTGNVIKKLHDVPKTPEISQNVMSAYGSMMGISERSVFHSAGQLNATNNLVESFETYMDGACTTLTTLNNCEMPVKMNTMTMTTTRRVEDVDFSNLGVRAHLSETISVFYVNPQCANISGMAIYDGASANLNDSLHVHARANFSYRFVTQDESLQQLIMEPGLQLASYIPTKLWTHIKSSYHYKKNAVNMPRHPVVVLKVYSNDKLFVEDGLLLKRKPNSKILSISIPGYDATNLPEHLPFLLRNEHFSSVEGATDSESLSSPNSGCGYWNYSTWDDKGVQTLNRTGAVISCGTNHLTQFSFLLGGSYRNSEIRDDVLVTALNQRVLDVISLIGCSLSLIGLCGIWLTALLFPRWRSKGPTKVLLNLCLALTVQMILFLVVQTEDVTEFLVSRQSYVPCLLLGALMQYSILVLFTWMLIIACLQFQRYVTVIGIQRPRHYILKSALLAWCIPLIPTVLVASIDPESYRPPDYLLITNNAICYPKGAALTFGVVLPVAIIVTANLMIFIYVSYSVAKSLTQIEQRNERQMFMRQVRLSVMLFFLLGLSWIFGLLAFMQAGIVFSYLFCLTATLQGFVLFIYFVLMSDEARGHWMQLLTGSKTAKTMELQSMSTSNTNRSKVRGIDTTSG